MASRELNDEHPLQFAHSGAALFVIFTFDFFHIPPTLSNNKYLRWGKTSVSISIFFTVSGRDRESLESPPIVA